MEEFVAYIIKNLVSEPEAVQVRCEERDNTFHISVAVASQDVGKVIGRKGIAINALRTIIRTVAARLERKAQLELVQTAEEESIALESTNSDSSSSQESFCCSADSSDEQSDLFEVTV